MVWLCLWLIIISFGLSLVLAQFVLRGSRVLGLLDPVGTEAHKLHNQPVPNTGGVAIFGAAVIPMVLAMLGVTFLDVYWWEARFPAMVEHLPGLRSMIGIGGGVVVAAAILHAMGLYDDRRALGPWPKLAIQIAVALMLVLFCDMRVLALLSEEIPFGQVVSSLVSVLWIVMIINAFNFLDNMDGLSAGVAAIITAIYLVATLIGGQWFVAGASALLLGALLGFLVYNFPPARMFMGDGGSLVVGMFLAVISIRTTYFNPVVPASGGLLTIQTQRPDQWWAVLMPLVMMAVPLYDLFSVTLIRLSEGRSPFRGDHRHFSHRLVALGLSRRRAVLVIWICTLATGFGGIMLGTLEQWQAMLVAVQVFAIMCLLALLEHGVRGKPPEGGGHGH